EVKNLVSAAGHTEGRGRGAAGGQPSRNDFWTPERGGFPAPTVPEIRQHWRIVVERVAPLTRKNDKGWSPVHRTRNEAFEGKQLTHLTAMTESDIVSEGLILRPGLKPNYVSIFSSPTGGFRRRLELAKLDRAKRASFYTGFNLSSIRYDLPA